MQRRVAAQWSAKLRAGERLIAHYSHDAVECSCAPSGNFNGIPILAVAHGDGVDRCLTCDTVWPAKRHRDDGRTPARGRGESLALWAERVA